jgi:hypothetical protein
MKYTLTVPVPAIHGAHHARVTPVTCNAQVTKSAWFPPCGGAA